MFKYLFLCFLFCDLFIGVDGLRAQNRTSTIQQDIYAEVPINDVSGEAYRLFPVGDQGVLLMLQSDEAIRGRLQKLILSFLDTDFNQKWTRAYFLEDKYFLADYFITDTHFYLLSYTTSLKYRFFKIDLLTGDVSSFDYENIKSFAVVDFGVMNDVILMSGNIKNYPVIIQIDLEKGSSRILSSLHQVDADIAYMGIDKKGKQLTVVLSTLLPYKGNSLFINQYDEKGLLLNNFALKRDPAYRLLSFQTKVLDNGKLFMCGSYGLKADNRAQGIYTMILNGDLMEDMKFYDFYYLHNFFVHMKEKRHVKLMSKIERLREKKDKIYHFRNEVLLSDFVEYEDQFIISGMYFEGDDDPNTRYVSNTMPGTGMPYSGYDAQGTSYSTPYSMQMKLEEGFWNYSGFVPSSLLPIPTEMYKSIPNRFEYKQMFVMSFSPDGQMIWDNAFSFPKNVSEFFPMSLVAPILTKEDSVVLMFPIDKRVDFTVGHHSSYSDSLNIVELPGYYDNTINKFEQGGVVNWYGDYILHSGVKRFKNDAVVDYKKVFFISKYSYGEESITTKKLLIKPNEIIGTGKYSTQQISDEASAEDSLMPIEDDNEALDSLTID